VTATFRHAPSFQDVDAIRVEDCGKAMRDQYRDGIAACSHVSNRLAYLILPLNEEVVDRHESTGRQVLGYIRVEPLTARDPYASISDCLDKSAYRPHNINNTNHLRQILQLVSVRYIWYYF